MNRSVLAAVTTAAMMALVSVSTADAATYQYTFTSTDGQLSASGDISVNGSNEVTAITGTIGGIVNQTISSIATNSDFPNYTTSSDGMFYYNNLYVSTSPYLDINGLLFSTAENSGGFWNLWFNSGNYSLWESVAGRGYAIQETGALTVAAVPELSTWAMMGLGFAGLALAGYRRAARSDALALG